jgi:hypothetical protein
LGAEESGFADGTDETWATEGAADEEGLRDGAAEDGGSAEGTTDEAGRLGTTEGALDEAGSGALETGWELTIGWADEAGTEAAGALDSG